MLHTILLQTPEVPHSSLLQCDLQRMLRPDGCNRCHSSVFDKLCRPRKQALLCTQHPSRPRFSNSKKYKDVDSLSVEFNAEQLLAAKGAFVSRFQLCIKSQEWTLEELDQRGFKVIEWDGRCVIFNSHHVSLIPLRSPAAMSSGCAGLGSLQSTQLLFRLLFLLYPKALFQPQG